MSTLLSRPGTAAVLGLDTPLTRVDEVDAAVAGLRALPGWPDDALVCAHVVAEPAPHYALSVTTPCPLHDDVVARARAVLSSTGDSEPARAQASEGSGGRATQFPGVDDLVGELTVGEVLARSSIDRVVQLGGGDADPDAVLVTRSFVRPRLTGGELVLAVQAYRGGQLVPFESPAPTPCCGARH